MGWTPAIGPGSGLAAFLIPQVLLFTVLLAHLSYRYLEEPARLFLRDRGPGRWARAERTSARSAGNAAPSPRPAAEPVSAVTVAAPVPVGVTWS
jgi:peptidoglycan/LPS O-acetylase OafA/YrhL